MNRFVIAILCAALMGGTDLARAASYPAGSQSPSQSMDHPGQSQPPASTDPVAPANAASTGNMLRIAPGSVIPVELAKSIDAKKAKTGDEVIAKATQDMKDNKGDIIVPKDTKFIGHVTEAQARHKEQKESQLGIAFDHAVMKTGEVQLPMSIQAVIAPPSNNPGNPNSGSDQLSSTSSSNGSGGMPQGGGRAGMGGSQAQPQTPSTAGAGAPADNTSANANTRSQITGNTQGIIGMADVKLSAPQNAAQGSLLTSDKNNVKLESGTMMLLRVNQ